MFCRPSAASGRADKVLILVPFKQHKNRSRRGTEHLDAKGISRVYTGEILRIEELIDNNQIPNQAARSGDLCFGDRALR